MCTSTVCCTRLICNHFDGATVGSFKICSCFVAGFHAVNIFSCFVNITGCVFGNNQFGGSSAADSNRRIGQCEFLTDSRYGCGVDICSRIGAQIQLAADIGSRFLVFRFGRNRGRLGVRFCGQLEGKQSRVAKLFRCAAGFRDESDHDTTSFCCVDCSICIASAVKVGAGGNRVGNEVKRRRVVINRNRSRRCIIIRCSSNSHGNGRPDFDLRLTRGNCDCCILIRRKSAERKQSRNHNNSQNDANRFFCFCHNFSSLYSSHIIYLQNGKKSTSNFYLEKTFCLQKSTISYHSNRPFCKKVVKQKFSAVYFAYYISQKVCDGNSCVPPAGETGGTFVIGIFQNFCFGYLTWSMVAVPAIASFTSV